MTSERAVGCFGICGVLVMHDRLEPCISRCTDCTRPCAGLGVRHAEACVRNDHSTYTCCGCHGHTPDKIRREHIEEGIRDFKDCVECHRSADEDDIRMPGSKRGSIDKRRDVTRYFEK